MRKPEYMPWNIYLDDLRGRVWDSITGKLACWRGKHAVKMSSYGKCIRCGKRVM